MGKQLLNIEHWSKSKIPKTAKGQNAIYLHYEITLSTVNFTLSYIIYYTVYNKKC